MENHLNILLKLTATPRHSALNSNIQLALDTLATQKLSFAFKAWQIRQKCLAVLKSGLESNNQLITMNALNGVEYVVNHPEFEGYTGEETLDSMDSKLLVVQVLDSLGYLPQLRDNEKLQGLKILLSLCCNFTTSFNGELVIKIVQMCAYCCHGSKVNRETQATAEALSTQAVARLANADISRDVTNDVIGLIKFFVQQLELSLYNSSRALYLECMLVILQILDPAIVRSSDLFLSHVQKELCQTLVSLLGLAIKGKRDKALNKNGEKHETMEQFSLYKKVFFISNELVRLIGSNEITGPAMDSLFHALFLWPVSQHKISVMKFLVCYLNKPKSLLQYLGYNKNTPNIFRYNLLKQILDDVMQFSHKCSNSIVQSQCDLAAINLVKAILTSLSNFHSACPLNVHSNNDIDKEISHGLSDNDLSLCSSPQHRMLKKFTSTEDLHTPSPCYLSAVEGSDYSDSEDFIEESDLSISYNNIIISNPEKESNIDINEEKNVCIEDSTSESDSDGDINKYLKESNAAYNSSKPSFHHINCQQEQVSQALAQHFLEKLTVNLPDLLSLDTVKKVDEKLLIITKQFCAEAQEKICSGEDHFRYIIQGESIYLLLFTTLLLNLKFTKSGHYQHCNLEGLSNDKALWIEAQQAQGIYLSKDFLDAVFYYVSQMNLLKIAGFLEDDFNFEKCDSLTNNMDLPIIIQMLFDVDGLGYQDTGSQFLIKSFELYIKVTGYECFVECINDDLCKDLPKLAFRAIWTRLVKLVGLVLRNNKKKVKKLSKIHLPNIMRPKDEKIDVQEFLCNEVAVDSLGVIIKLSCWFNCYKASHSVLSEIIKNCLHLFPYLPKVHVFPFYISCLDSVLSYTAEISTHSPDCWQYFFHIAEHIKQLYNETKETYQYNYSKDDFVSLTISDMLSEDAINTNLYLNGDGKSSPCLTEEYSIKCIHFLYWKLISIFEFLSKHLNCQAVIRFLQEIRKTSYVQLFVDQEIIKSQQISNTVGWEKFQSTLFLINVEDCTMQCIKVEQRPFLHVFHAWNAAAPHFVEASCHLNCSIAENAVTFLHNILTYFLSIYDEEKYFYICEAFLRPVERAMQLDGCNRIIQDKLVECVIDLVVTYPSKIKSGWRCLFNALRYANVENVSILHCNTPVFDVFKVFTSVTDMSINAMALHESIKCLFKLLNGFGEIEKQENDYKDAAKDQFILYLTKISGLLEKTYNSNTSVTFNGCNTIDVAPIKPDEGKLWDKLTSPQWLQDQTAIINAPISTPTIFNKGDVLYVWFSFLDQMSNSALTCPTKYQACITKLLTNFIEDLWIKPGPEFAFHTVFYVCMPLLYSWLQRIKSMLKSQQTSAKRLENSDHEKDTKQLLTYKHVFGSILQITSKMISDYMKELHNRHNHENDNLFLQVKLVWTASLNLCLYCIDTNSPAVAKLGCSCLNHLFCLTKPFLFSEMLDDVCNVIHYAIQRCLDPLKLLMACFPITNNKCEKPLTYIDVEIYFAKENELYLANNMENFMFTFQGNFAMSEFKNPFIKDCLLFINSGENFDEVITLTFCSLGVNMSSLLVLTKYVESLLLENSIVGDGDNLNIGKQENCMLNKFHPKHVSKLLHCLSNVSSSVASFERRLSLKFLLQRLSNLPNLANLHRIQAQSFSSFIEILFSICSMRLKDSLSKEVVLKNIDVSLPFVDIVDDLSSVNDEKLFLKMQEKQNPKITPNAKKTDTGISDYLTELHDTITMLCQEYKYIYLDKPEEKEKKQLSSTEENNAVNSLTVNENKDENNASDMQPLASSSQLPPENLLLSGSEVLDLNWTHDYMAYVRKPSQSDEKSQNKAHCTKRSISLSSLTSKAVRGILNNLVDNNKSKKTVNKSNSSFIGADAQSHLQVWNNMVCKVLYLSLQLDDEQTKKMLPFLYGPLLHLSTETRDNTTRNLFENWLRKVGILYKIIPSRHVY